MRGRPVAAAGLIGGDPRRLDPAREDGGVKIQRKHAVLFLAIAAWNVLTYATFTKNLAAAHASGEDRPTGYWVAHSVLIVVNLVIAARAGPARRPGLAGDQHRPAEGRRMRRHLPATVAAVTATAVVGGLGADVRSRWYADLDRPAWEPPGWAFPVAWTTLYGLIAVASGRVLDRAPAKEREGVRAGARRQPRAEHRLDLAVLHGQAAALGAGRDPAAAGLHARPGTTRTARRPRRARPAGAVRRVGGVRHRAERQHRPPQPLRRVVLTPEPRRGAWF